MCLVRDVCIERDDYVYIQTHIECCIIDIGAVLIGNSIQVQYTVGSYIIMRSLPSIKRVTDRIERLKQNSPGFTFINALLLPRTRRKFNNKKTLSISLCVRECVCVCVLCPRACLCVCVC